MKNVKSFGADPNGKELCTKAVQQAIDECYKEGGGAIIFEKGHFLLSTVFLRSNVTVIIKKDAVILGTDNFNDYLPDEEVDYPLFQDASHSFFNCSMFVGKNCSNISIIGEGKIDMQSIWDVENKRDMAHRGAKCIALKECLNVEIGGICIDNATDLAVYFAGCRNVLVHDLKMRVYIDGISPDNSEDVLIRDCDIETGDDGIVFKSSYTLNRLGKCRNISVKNCKIKSRCNAIKFGTETNGGFEQITVEDIEIYDTRITGISIESVDGAIVDGIRISNVCMKNTPTPLFIHLGKRMRGPKGLSVGEIKNILIENVKAEGPYVPAEIIPWNYQTFIDNDLLQQPFFNTCNVCGLAGKPLKNVTFNNFSFILEGGATEYPTVVPEEGLPYPEVYAYGRVLPACGIYFRHVDGLTLNNVRVRTYKEDARENFVFDSVCNLEVYND